MDTVTVRVKGLDRLLKGLEAAPASLDHQAEAAMKDSVVVIQGQVEQRIPLGPGRFGHMRNLVTTTVTGSPVRGMVDVHKFTAPMLEGGTKPHLIKITRSGQSMYGPYQQTVVIHHPGAKAQHPMKQGADAAKEYIRARFLRAASEVVRQMANG